MDKNTNHDGVLETALRRFGIENQTRMLFEEMAELQDALCKLSRDRVTAEAVITEIADVKIMLRQLELHYGEDAVAAETERKLQRLIELIEHDRCVPFIAKNTYNRYNGYVAVPPSNRYYGMPCFDIKDIDIHGGITLSEPVLYQAESFMTKRKISDKYIGTRHIVLRNGEFLSDTEVGDDWWIFGFHTCHSGDSWDTWGKRQVIEETFRLLEQLERKQ